MKLLILTHGLPGSGKSTLAKRIKAETEAEGRTCEIFETDDYFTQPDGTYKFVGEECGKAHKLNYKKTLDAMQRGVDVVIVGNTNLYWKEIKPYVAIALANSYHSRVIEPDTGWSSNLEILFKRNVHKVPMITLERMFKKKQDIGYLREKIKRAYSHVHEW